MANEIEIKFGTFTMDSGTELSISPPSFEESKPVNLHKIPKSQGSIAEVALREAISIAISGTIKNSDYDALRASIDDLSAALHNGMQKFTNDDDRFIMAQLESFRKLFRSRSFATFTANFIAHFPFWLSETEHEDDRQPTSTVGYVISNAGNAPARCKIEITAPSGGISDDAKIENQTTGETFRYRGDIAESEVLVVDNRYDGDDFVVENDGADAHADFEGDFITLQPGNNTIIFTGPANTAVKITYRDTWY